MSNDFESSLKMPMAAKVKPSLNESIAGLSNNIADANSALTELEDILSRLMPVDTETDMKPTEYPTDPGNSSVVNAINDCGDRVSYLYSRIRRLINTVQI